MQVSHLRLDAALRGAAVHFCGGAAPLAAAAEARLAGAIALARQATVPPAMYERDIAVGRARAVRVALPAKHARPLVKAFTDLRADVADVTSTYGVGLEPTIALVPYPTLTPPHPYPTQQGCSCLPSRPYEPGCWFGPAQPAPRGLGRHGG